jgi:hypothetical protein
MTTHLLQVAHTDEALGKIMWVLLPKQQAQFYLEVDFRHKSVIQLKSMWEAMKNSIKSADH